MEKKEKKGKRKKGERDLRWKIREGGKKKVFFIQRRKERGVRKKVYN